MDSNRKATVWVIPLALFGLAATPYLFALDVPFVYDDLHSVLNNPSLTTLKNLTRFFVDPTCFDASPDQVMYRPLLLVSYAYNFAWAGMEPWVFHLTNVILHAITTLLVYWCLVEISRRISGLSTMPEIFPVLAAVIFAVHPVHSEPVVYVSGRSDGLSTLFVVASILSYLVATRGETGVGFRWLALSIAAFVCAVLTKATGIVVPALILALETFLPRSMERSSGDSFLGALAGRVYRSLPPIVPFAMVAIGYLVLRHAILGETGIALSADRFADDADVLTGGGRGILTNLITQTKCLVVYGQLLLWPGDLNVDHFVSVASSLSDPAFLKAAGLVVCAVGTVIVFSRKRPMARFFSVWILIGLAPTSSIIPLNVILTERRLYVCGLGSAGLLAEMILAALLWIHVRVPFRNARRVAMAVGIAMIVGCAARTFVRLGDWKDPVRLWEQAIVSSPQSARAHRNLGLYLAARGDGTGAVEAFREAVRLHPEYSVTRVNFGESLRRLGEKEGDVQKLAAAEEQFREVLKDAPDHRMLLHKLALTLVVKGRLAGTTESLENAVSIYERLVEVYPGDPVAQTFLAMSRDELKASLEGVLADDGGVLGVEPSGK